MVLKFSYNMSENKKTAGFSLIEIIVIMIILVSLTGLITANYVDYTEEMKLNEAATQLRTSLTTARARALAGDIGPYVCNEFGGYKVLVSEASNSAKTTLCCDGACTASYDIVTATFKSNIDIQIASDSSILFKPYAQGVTINSVAPIVLKNSFLNKCHWVQINAVGVVEVGYIYEC